jgi:hypothetical protein
MAAEATIGVMPPSTRKAPIAVAMPAIFLRNGPESCDDRHSCILPPPVGHLPWDSNNKIKVGLPVIF